MLNRLYLREYIDKMVRDAMNSLGTHDNPSDLSKLTHRQRTRDRLKPFDNPEGIHRNSWLVHVTSPENAFSIMKHGFKSRVKDLKFRATQDFDYDTDINMDIDGLCFAFHLYDDDCIYSAIQQSEDYGEDWALVVFQADCFDAFTSFGDMYEVIFGAKSAHNMIIALPMTEEEVNKYCKYTDCDSNDVMLKFIGKDGTILRVGSLYNLLHCTSMTRKPTTSRFENWLNNNISQYRNKFSHFK